MLSSPQRYFVLMEIHFINEQNAISTLHVPAKSSSHRSNGICIYLYYNNDLRMLLAPRIMYLHKSQVYAEDWSKRYSEAHKFKTH